MGELDVIAVVVTWNRRDLLRECLAAIAAQTRPPDRLIVVDNASTDGTGDLVSHEFPAARLLSLARNYGGAGGFQAGIAEALTSLDDLDRGAIWVMDDDSVPEPSALAELIAVWEGYVAPPAPARLTERPALVASAVVWTDGRPHPLNTPRRWPWAGRAVRRAASAVGCVPIRSASFVSILLTAGWVERRGTPIADYFLWNDDFEYTTRLIRGQVGLLCPRSVVVHKTAAVDSATRDPGPRFRYEVRNKIWTFVRSDGLNIAEKLVFGAATTRRWGAILLSSTDRAELARAGWHGLCEGLRRGPRPVAIELADPPAGRRDG